MTTIENFAALTAQEQIDFANALLKTINTEHIFSSDTDFKLTKVSVSDFDGNLEIDADCTDALDIPREATWACSVATDLEGYYEAIEEDPEDPEFAEHLENDVLKVFKTTSAVIEGYKVTLVIADVDDVETAEVKAEEVNKEDAGIGSYEYWGFPGYDSSPYLEVIGTITKTCNVYVGFDVEPADSAVEN